MNNSLLVDQIVEKNCQNHRKTPLAVGCSTEIKQNSLSYIYDKTINHSTHITQSIVLYITNCSIENMETAVLLRVHYQPFG